MSENYESSYAFAKIRTVVYKLTDMLNPSKKSLATGPINVLNNMNEDDKSLWDDFLSDLDKQGLNFINTGKANDTAIVDTLLLNPANPDYIQKKDKTEITKYLKEKYPEVNEDSIKGYCEAVLKYETYS